MVSFRAFDLGWVKGIEDDPADQCVHGGIELCIEGETVLETESNLTVSGACLYLLRTIEDDHTPGHSVAEGNWLLPCCGFSVWSHSGEYPVICIGCNKGSDIWVEHKGIDVDLFIGERSVTVSVDDWARAIVGLANQVEVYYGRCQPKEGIDDDEDGEGWALFWMEWKDRKHRALRRGT